MRRRLKAGAIAAAAALGAGNLLWDRGTARMAERIASRTRASNGVAPTVYSRDQLAGLPAPVVRYFEFALTPGQPLVRQARIRQAGTFAQQPGSWSPFTAIEQFNVRPPAFVWDARIRMAPLVSVRVRDSYVDEEGATLAKVAGLITVANLHGTPELASGALLRHLAEAAWFPTALLPSEGVKWEAIDDSTARATLTSGATTASLELGFGEGGEIVKARAMRYRAVGDTFLLTPWSAEYRAYERMGDMMIPTEAEVQWELPDGAYPYWRGRTVSAEYSFANMAP